MKLAVFDFDGTLFDEETLPFLVKYYGRKGYSKRRFGKFWLNIIGLTAKYKLKLEPKMDKEQYRAKASTIFMLLFEGMTKEEIIDFFKAAASDMTQHFNGSVVAAVKAKKAEGFHTVVCSGANTLLLNEIKAYVDFDTVIGTELYFLEDGTYDYEAPMLVTTGVNKPPALMDRFKGVDVDWKESWAYGDSYYDYEVLTLTGNPVAVNPDEGLRKYAEDEGWPVMDSI